MRKHFYFFSRKQGVIKRKYTKKIEENWVFRAAETLKFMTDLLSIYREET